MKKMMMFVVVMFVFFGCGQGYSNGDRVGTISKFSQKGLVIKSWEGQAILGGTIKTENGSVANTFDFSVTNDELAKEIVNILDSGKTVKLTYSQWFIGPPSISSDYVVTAIKVIQ